MTGRGCKKGWLGFENGPGQKTQRHVGGSNNEIMRQFLKAGDGNTSASTISIV